MNRANNRYVVLGDGRSDAALLPIVEWAIDSIDSSLPLGGHFEQHHGRISKAVASARGRVHPLFVVVHRDAETADPQERRDQIPTCAGTVRCVPVRMTEAWLLTNEHAIRHAAGNPNGKMTLDLPPVKRLERLPDPKKTLEEILIRASGRSGPRRRKLFRQRLSQVKGRASELTDDFAPLFELSAFRLFHEELGTVLAGIKRS